MSHHPRYSSSFGETVFYDRRKGYEEQEIDHSLLLFNRKELSSQFLQTTQRQYYGHKLYQRIQKLCECILQAHKRTGELDNKETRRY